MFEKDAEKHKEHFVSAALNLGMSLNTTETIGAQKEESFREGAEFGYNKANEWHYVKDRDYPKEKGNYLVAWKRTHHVEEYGEWGFDVDLFNADEGYFEGVGDYVIAWKEIVLPKESE